MKSKINRINASKSNKIARIWFVFVLGSLAALGPLSIDMYLPALPDLTNELKTNTSIAQLSLTACLIGIALGQLLVGPLSDMKGRKKPLILAMLLYSLASLLCVFSPSIWALILLRFVQGIAGAAGIVIARASVRDLYSGTELTKFFALLMLVNGAAPILAPIAGGQLLHFTSWRGVFVTLFMIGLLLWLCVIFGLPETLPKERRSTGGLKKTLATFRILITDREFMGFALTQGLVYGAMFAYISGSPFVLQDIFNVSPQMFSLIFAVNGIGIIAATQTTGRLAGKIPELKMLLFGLSTASIGALSLLISIVAGAGLVIILPSLFFVVASVGIVGTNAFSLAMEKQAERAGSAAALLGLLQFCIGATAAPLVGIAGSHTALPMALVIVICDLGALLLFIGMQKKKDRNVSQQLTS